MKKLLSFCLFVIISVQIQASDYYWVGGSGNWSDYASHWATVSGGTTFRSQVPTNLDNVYFDQNSGFISGSKTVTVDQTIVYCKNMDWTGVLNYPSFQSSFYGNTLKVFGSLKLSPNANFDFNASLSFEATSAGNTITCSGKTIMANTIYFNGINGEWTFVDIFNAKKIVHNAGTIHTNNLTLNITGFEASSTTAALFDIGTSILNITQNTSYLSGNPYPTWTITNSNYVFNPSQATLNFLGTHRISFTSYEYDYNIINAGTRLMDFYCKDCNIGELNFSGDGNIRGSSIFEKLQLSQGGIYNVQDTITITNSGSLIANGTCSKPIFIQCESLDRTAVYMLRKNTGTINVNYVYLQNARTSGTASFNATNSYILGNVSGWNVTNPIAQNLYWIGGSGNWSDPAHWSTTSGGSVISGCVPTYADNVFFDQNSGLASGNYVSLDIYKSQCKNMNWSGITNNNVRLDGFNNFLYISGSLILSPKLTFSFTNTQTILNAQSIGHTINCAGKTIPGKLVLDGIGGEWTLADSLTATNVEFYNGSLVTNNKNITLSTFSATPDNNNSVKLNLQNSLVKVTGGGGNYVWQLIYPKVDFQCGTSTIILNNTTTAQSFNTGSYQFYNVYSLGLSGSIQAGIIRKLYFKGDGILRGNQTYDSLILSEAHSYQLNNASYTINQGLVANGTCGKFITITGSSYYNTTINKSSGTVSCNGLILSNCNAAGGASFIASNSIANTPITGWTVTAYVPRNLYWVGGSGNWTDINHWSSISGGTAGQCIPTQFDNVNFNQNSGLIKGSSITIPNTITAEFKNMDWSGINAKCTFNAGTVKSYGSMILHDSVTVIMNPTFLSPNNETIKSCKNKFSAATFDGAGGWKLLDNFTTTGAITQKKGSLIADGYTITAGLTYYAVSSDPVTLDIRNSKLVIVKGAFFALYPPFPFTLLKDNSVIEFLNQDPFWYPAGINFNSCCIGSEPTTGIQFGKVICRNSSAKFFIREGTHSFTYLAAEGGINGVNSYTFDTLSLTPGRTYTFAGGTTQTINSLLDAIGQPGFPIEILSGTVGNAVSFSKSSGIVCCEYLYLKDIHAIGGATFYAGDNGANVANNNGWFFANCNSQPTEVVSSSILNEILLYPVPTNSDLHVMIPSDGTYTFKMYNAQNEELISELLDGRQEYIMPTSNYISGIYYISISGKDEFKTYKISIIH